MERAGMDVFSFVAGACFGILAIVFLVIGLTIWSMRASKTNHSRGWQPSEYSTEDDAGRMIIVGEDH